MKYMNTCCTKLTIYITIEIQLEKHISFKSW